MEISRKWRFWCFLLGLFVLATNLQDVQGEVESEAGPSESECRPYIEKALKKLENVETEPANSETIVDESDTQSTEATIDDSEHETGAGEDDIDKGDVTESTESQQDTISTEASVEDQAQEASAESKDEKSAEQDDSQGEQIVDESKSDEVDVDSKAEESQEEQEEGATESVESVEQNVEESNAESVEQGIDEQSEQTDEEGDSVEGDNIQNDEVKESQESEDTKVHETEEDDSQAESKEEVAESTASVEAEDNKSQEEVTTESQETEESQDEAKPESDEKESTKEDDSKSVEETAQSAESQEKTEEEDSKQEEVDQSITKETEESKEADSKAEESAETAASVEEVETTQEEKSVEGKSDEDEKSAEQEKSDEQDKSGEQEKSDEQDKSGEQGKSDEQDKSGEQEKSDEQDKSGEQEKSAEASAEDTAESKEESKTEVKESEASNVETSGEQSKESEVSEEKPQSDEESTEGESKESVPEEDLTLEMEIPENLRPRQQIDQILKLDNSYLESENVINRIAEVTSRELKRLYENAIKPLETLYKYRDLSNRHFGDSEIFSKPLVLFMGPWSGGKSSIINYLLNNEYNKTSLRTGAEPSPAYFNLVMYGDEPEVLDGTQLAADFTFAGLQKFGQGLEERLRGLKLPNKLLEKVNIVEIPGILEVRKQVSRVFPFNDACQWFIDRADIIFLVYDPSKLDVGPETEAILDQLKGREHQTRIILNKADQVKPEELMRVQGALIWNISPLMSSAQPPVMYTTSLWSRPYETWAPVRLLHAQESAFLKDLRSAVDKRIENKISSARRFAVRVRNHAKMVDCYLTTYYNHKSVFGNRKQVADQIIEHPQDYHIYEGLSTLTNISRYDLPDPDVYRDFFRLNPLYEFQQLSATCTYFRGCPINRLDVAIAYDLPELVGKHKKMIEAAVAGIKTES